jgi:hypothetical protein
MAQSQQRTPPMMRRTARLQTNKARAKGGKEGQHFFPAQRLGNNNLTRSVTAVNLKNMLC